MVFNSSMIGHFQWINRCYSSFFFCLCVSPLERLFWVRVRVCVCVVVVVVVPKRKLVPAACQEDISIAALMDGLGAAGAVKEEEQVGIEAYDGRGRCYKRSPRSCCCCCRCWCCWCCWCHSFFYILCDGSLALKLAHRAWCGTWFGNEFTLLSSWMNWWYPQVKWFLQVVYNQLIRGWWCGRRCRRRL